MRIVRVFLCVLSVIGALSFNSCKSDGDEPSSKTSLQDTFYNYFSYYIGYDQDGNRQVSAIYPVEEITLSFDDASGKADVVLTNFATGKPGAFNYINVTMRDLPFKTDSEGVRSIRASNVDGGSMKMDDVRIAYYPDKTVNDTVYHGLACRIKVNSGNDLTIMPRNIACFGTTVTAPVTGGTPYESERTSYIISLTPESRTASVTVIGSDFDPNMPAMDMEFASKDPTGLNSEKMRMSLDPGLFRLSSDTIVPTIKGRPYPSFKITDLNGECVTADNKMTLNFGCGGRWTVSAELTGCYVRQLSK